MDNSQIVECVPNFSEGRDPQRIERIIAPLRARKGVKLLDYQCDRDHNRMVVTIIGTPEPLCEALFQVVEKAIDCIDMRTHVGQHPRMGAIDVIPFVPVKNMEMSEAVDLSVAFARKISAAFDLPVFLYEAAARNPARVNLATIRSGRFEGMAEKLKSSDWQPDYGPSHIHPTAGVTAVGARMPLVAFNVNLNTDNMAIADAIAEKVRHINGGLRYCKGIGVLLKERGQVQVSMNMTDFTKTALYRAFELIRIEAARYGVAIVGSEIVGLLPMAALVDAAAYYLQIEKFSYDQILENRLLE